MIYTLTFNPSLDYIINVDNFKTGTINKTTSELILPGGKGINVSIVLNNLNITSTALGFIAGFTGKQIQFLCANHGLNTNFIHVEEGMSRINIKMHSDNETEINGNGPIVKSKHIHQLFDQLHLLKDGDLLIISGSVPNCLPSNIYEQILKILSEKQIHTIIDTRKTLLLNCLKYKPFLIKPNNHELSEIFNVKLQSVEQIIPYALQLQQSGAQNVLVSMADQGAILIDEFNNTHVVKAPKGKVINSVGAGDSMVAGFIASYLKYKNYERALKYSVACGSASAFSHYLASKEETDLLYTQIEK